MCHTCVTIMFLIFDYMKMGRGSNVPQSGLVRPRVRSYTSSFPNTNWMNVVSRLRAVLNHVALRREGRFRVERWLWLWEGVALFE